ELGQLGLAGTGDGDGPLDQGVVEAADDLEAPVVDAGDHLRGVLEGPLWVARIDALGAVAQMEVGAGAKAASRLEQGRHELVGGAGIGGRLEDDRRPWAQMDREGSGGVFDV